MKTKVQVGIALLCIALSMVIPSYSAYNIVRYNYYYATHMKHPQNQYPFVDALARTNMPATSLITMFKISPKKACMVFITPPLPKRTSSSLATTWKSLVTSCPTLTPKKSLTIIRENTSILTLTARFPRDKGFPHDCGGS